MSYGVGLPVSVQSIGMLQSLCKEGPTPHLSESKLLPETPLPPPPPLRGSPSLAHTIASGSLCTEQHAQFATGSLA